MDLNRLQETLGREAIITYGKYRIIVGDKETVVLLKRKEGTKEVRLR